MQKIVPHLWFDKEAKAAADFYVSIFPKSKINHYSVIKDTPSGDSEIVAFDLDGYSFMAISAGPVFKINPSISFFLNFDPSKDKNAEKNLRAMWEKLNEGGKTLMPLQEYPFSKLYGWTEDKFGVSWQLMLTNPDGEERPFIIPSLMFTKDMAGRAEEATDFYISVFKNTKRGTLAKYPNEAGEGMENMIMFTDFMIEKQWFAAMDAPGPHEFSFSEGLSLLINCKDQKELDYYADKLSAVPEAEQCGWVKDRYGVSWQAHPIRLEEMLTEGTPEQAQRVTQAFLQMKRFNLAELEKAYKAK